MCCFPSRILSQCHLKMWLFLTAITVLLFTSCGTSKEEQELPKSLGLPYQIDLQTAYKAGAEVPLSSFAESVEYIALETTEASLIGRGANFYIFGDHIVSIAFRQVFLFDRNTGAFIKELRSYGPGPDQYHNTSPFIHPNEEKQVVYIRDNREKRVGMSIDGSIKVSFRMPSDEGYLPMSYAELGEDLFIGFHPNWDCKQTENLVVFDAQGKVIKTFPNHQSCINYNPNSIAFNGREGQFYYWQKQIGFKEEFSDTLYRVNADTLFPLAVFGSGEYALVYKEKRKFEGKSKTDFHQVSRLDETANYLFFQLNFRGIKHSALLDKATGETRLVRSGNSEVQAFANDLDGFLPFRLRYATNEGLLVGHMEAPDVLNWMEEHPEKASQLPEELKRFGQLSVEGNPVVMVVKLKD